MNLKDRYKKPKSLKRKHLQVFLLNEKEMEALAHYCKRYKIENRSKFIRETIFKHIIDEIENDYPTLFSSDEMTQMVQK